MNTLVLGHPDASDNGILKDLDASETFWDVFNSGTRGYSGWGTGGQVPSSSLPAVYGTYSAYTQPGYGNPWNYAAGYDRQPYVGYTSQQPYVGYANRQPIYAPFTSSVNAKPPAIYTGYTGYSSSQPTYENYGIHGGHGFGKYGNY